MCYDDSGAEAWCQRERRARKTHRCCECWRAIPVGEQYVQSSGVHDGSPFRYRSHIACEALRDFVRDVVCGGHGYIPMCGLEEEIDEAGEYIDSDHDAWEAAGLEPPNPLREVFDFIKASYPEYEPAAQP